MDLDLDQTRAVGAPPGHLAILAGPGSGKTTTLVARIAALAAAGDVDVSRAWALTHTTKAAGELRDRLRLSGVSGVACSTVHAAAWRMVRRWWAESSRAGSPVLVSDTFRLVASAVREHVSRPSNELIADIRSEMSYAAAWCSSPDDYEGFAVARSRRLDVSPSVLASVWRSYVEVKQLAGVLDFDDVIAVATEMMSVPEIAADVRSRVGFLFVDEYQDIDDAQQRLLDLWVVGGHLCVVGDVDQAVFGFKGANPRHLDRFRDSYRSAVVVELGTNYRSSPQIVKLSTVFSTKAPMLTTAPSGDEPRVSVFSSEASEERGICSQIRRWNDAGVGFSEMAVLYRFNASSARFEAAFAEAGIPYHVAGSQRFFDRQEIRAVLVPFGRAARAQPDGCGFDLLCEAAQRSGYDASSPPAGAGAARQRHDAVAALLDLAAGLGVTLSAEWLLSELLERACNHHEVDPHGVTLATVHAAKGLEWDAVVVAGVTEGQIPSAYAVTGDELDEERRLLYVAVTRPRRHLMLTSAHRRHNKWRSKPSRFLDELGHFGSRV